MEEAFYDRPLPRPRHRRVPVPEEDVNPIDTLPWPAISAAAGGWTLFAIAGWFVLTGRLVPQRYLKDVEHDRNEWRTESRIKDQQIAEKDTQLRHLSEVGESHKALIVAIQQLSEKARS